MPSVYEDILNTLKELEKQVKNLNCCPSIPTYTPTSSSDTYGKLGAITYDSSFLYIKTGAGWKRVAISSF
jgi:hypothetical protein